MGSCHRYLLSILPLLSLLPLCTLIPCRQMEKENYMEDKETSRLEAFSDGVFAVAITLLVLNIKPPPDLVLTGGGLGFWKELGVQLPALLAFVTSFFTIGIMWINHHRLFNLIKRTDTGLLLFNLLLLLV